MNFGPWELWRFDMLMAMIYIFPQVLFSPQYLASHPITHNYLFIHQIKNISTFFIISIIFYYYSNKKIHYKTKLFYFSIKHSQILYHINYFLLLFK